MPRFGFASDTHEHRGLGSTAHYKGHHLGSHHTGPVHRYPRLQSGSSFMQSFNQARALATRHEHLAEATHSGALAHLGQSKRRRINSVFARYV